MPETRRPLRGLQDPIRTPCEAAIAFAVEALTAICARGTSFPHVKVSTEAVPLARQALDKIATVYPEAMG